MCRLINYIIIVCVLGFYSCSKQTKAKELTDKELIASITTTNIRRSIKKIDSSLANNEYSNHQKGILFSERGRLLTHLDDDIKAISDFKKALFLYGDKKTRPLANVYQMLGDSYAVISKLDTAFMYTDKAHKTFYRLCFKTDFTR